AGRIDGGGGREHEALDPGAAHGLEQSDAAQCVVFKILARRGDGLTDFDEGGHVDHRVDAVLGQDALERLLVADVTLDPGAALRHRVPVAVRQVVVDHDGVTQGEQRLGHHTADVAGAAGDENVHTLHALNTF